VSQRMANARKEVHQNATFIKDIIPNSGGLGQPTRNEEVEGDENRLVSVQILGYLCVSAAVLGKLL